MRRNVFFLLMLIMCQTILLSQGTNYDYDRIRIGEAKHIVSELALSPDLETLAISPVQSFPFYLFDWKNQQVLEKFNVGNWYAGSSINYLTNKFESFELEDMQGVYGLKALRVEINLKGKEIKDLNNMEKIAIEAMNIEI